MVFLPACKEGPYSQPPPRADDSFNYEMDRIAASLDKMSRESQPGQFRDGSLENAWALEGNFPTEGVPEAPGTISLALALWNPMGNVRFVDAGEDLQFQLISDDRPASIGQAIAFREGAQAVRFDLWVASATADSRLAVFYNGLELDRLKLKPGFKEVSVALTGNPVFKSMFPPHPPHGEIRLRLEPSDPPSMIRLDNLTIAYPR